MACNRGDKTPEPQYDVNCKATHLMGTYHGTEYSEAYNYNIVLSDANADSDSFAPNASYYYFEIYSDIYSKGGEYIDLPVASNTSRQYRYDQYSRRRSGFFSAENSYAIFTDNEGNTTQVGYSDGTLTLKHNGSSVEITAELVLENGTTHCVKYSGPRQYHNLTNQPYSTLRNDIELSLSDTALYTEHLGEYTNSVDCYYIMLSEDANFKDGKTIILELLLPSYSEVLYGTYNAFDNRDSYAEELYHTYFPGAIEQETLRGAWYVELVGGSAGSVMAPIMGGEIKIAEGDNLSTIFTFDCYDDASNKISGTVTTSTAL
ncbi:MAG: hypothetical protein J6R90_01690 [Alistipes sp.]|nr:hypothetical protein [Alistipes sp.]